jgi:hypothetical protein
MSITNDIEQAIGNVDWGSVLETILASAREQAAEGKAFVKIRLTPQQTIGNLPCDEDDHSEHHWTSGRAYRKAYEKRLEEIVSELGFEFHRSDSVKGWREGNTWILQFTVSWEHMLEEEDVEYYEEECDEGEDCEEDDDEDDEDYEEDEEDDY